MEGNKFHDPETPPPLDLETLHPFTKHLTNHEADDSESSEKTLHFDERIDMVGNLPTENTTEQRRESHTDRAFHLVDTVTRNKSRRKPSKAGILSNLLKLDTFDEKRRQQETTTHGAASAPRIRPSYQLKSIASSRALLQSAGVSPKSARNSLYYDDLQKQELGIVDDATVAAHRMAIASEIADILQRQDLLIKMGKSLVRSGAPSHRIEAAMDQVGKRLEIDGSYAVLPGLIVVTFGDVETHTSETHLIRCSRSLDIGKMERSNIIAQRIAKGELNLDEATELLDGIINEPPTWSPPALLLGYVASSAFVAPLFFNGSWTDCWVSAIFGLVVGILTYISEKIPMFSNIFELAVPIPVAIVALALHPHVCFVAVVMSAIVIALPGYSLTSSVMELAAKNLISGTVHLAYSIMYVLFLAFGIGYGCSVWRLAHPGIELDVLNSCQEHISPWWNFLLLPLCTIAIAVVYGASANQWLPMIADSAVGFTCTYFLNQYIGATSIITPSVGAFALGLVGNIYARVTKRLAFVPLMGGTIILVPGSIGVRGAVTLFDGSNNGSGSGFVFQILGIALSITLGLFLANLVVFPMGKKRSIWLGF